SALTQISEGLPKEDNDNACVLLEIGGNDLLGETPAEQFGQDLEALLIAARGDLARPRRMIMLELPVPPGQWAFAAKQRQLAAKFNVLLVPKRLLAAVILNSDSVLDGLHLSPAGHERMAQLLAPWLGQPQGF